MNPEKTPSENKSQDKYAVLMETSGEECESWYYFLKYNGNEKNLLHLQKQLQKVDWYILDDLSTFDLEMDHLISAESAKEFIKLDLNHHSPHRKFDGKLQEINLSLKSKYSNDKKMLKIFEKLGYGQIENYISGEDISNGRIDIGQTPAPSSEDSTDTGDDLSSQNLPNYLKNN